MTEAKKEAPKAVVAKDIQNDVTRPKAGTKTGRVWEISDAMSQAEGAPVARKKVLEAATAEDINTSTAATQYGRWRKYHGLAAEVKTVEAAAPAVAEDQGDSDIQTEADAG